MRSTASTFAAFLARDVALARTSRWTILLELGGVIVYAAPFFYLSHLLAPDANQFPDVNGHYFWSVLIGVTYVGVAYACISQFSKRVRDDQLSGALEALLATPVPSMVVVLATASYEVLRALVLGVLTVVLGIAIFGVRLDFSVDTVLGLGIALPASIVLLTAVGIVLAGLTLYVKRVAPLTGLLAGVLTLISGTYFPVSELPDGLEALARACPITWTLQWIRVGLLGGEASGWELFGIVASAAVAVPLAWWTFERAVRHAKRTGSLVLY